MAVTLNGEEITLEEYQQEIQRYQDGLRKAGATLPPEEQQKQQVLDELINQLLLKQGAVEAGFTVSAEEIQSRLDQLSQQLGGHGALTAWQQSNFYTDSVFRIAFGRSIYATWMRDKLTAEVPLTAEQVHAQQIRVLSEPEAKGILAQLTAGTDFSDLAALYDPLTKGDLGWFPRGYLTQPAVEEAAFSLQPGAHSGVIKTDVGYHIVKLLELDAQHALTPDALQFMQQQAIQNWLAEQKTSTDISITP